MAKSLSSTVLMREQVRPVTQALLYGATVLGWTMFETLCADLWILSVNEQPKKVATHALAAEGDNPEGFAKKSIELGLVIKNGFDLRSCMGTLLQSKFDFSGVDGIRRAYKVFEKAPLDALDGRDIAELEATRHLIVHRGGIVDQRFLNRTGRSLIVGSELVLDGAEFARLTNAAISAGCAFIRFIDQWLLTVA